ncbi:MAG: bifunctional DNase/RNase [Planctomycetota bacterium]|jgi:bifunctional DNase/RNase
MEADSTMIPMRLSRIVIRDGTDQQWIFLNEVDGERGFAIIIGPAEATEIRRVVSSVETERPLTHQLTNMVIDALDAKLVGIDVVDLSSNTFFARLLLQKADSEEVISVDARPSDALALALRAGCTIRVAEHVLEQARTDASGPDPMPQPPEAMPGFFTQELPGMPPVPPQQEQPDAPADADEGGKAEDDDPPEA